MVMDIYDAAARMTTAVMLEFLFDSHFQRIPQVEESRDCHQICMGGKLTMETRRFTNTLHKDVYEPETVESMKGTMKAGRCSR